MNWTSDLCRSYDFKLFRKQWSIIYFWLYIYIWVVYKKVTYIKSYSGAVFDYINNKRCPVTSHSLSDLCGIIGSNTSTSCIIDSFVVNDVGISMCEWYTLNMFHFYILTNITSKLQCQNVRTTADAVYKLNLPSNELIFVVSTVYFFGTILVHILFV